MVVTLLLAVAASCSTATQTAADPWAARWNEAELIFATGDFDETLRRVEKLIDAPEPYRASAAAWKMLVLAGKARGYFELAEAHQQGAQENGGHASLLWRATSTYRSRCRIESLALAEMALAADQYLGGADAIGLDFPLPPATAAASSLVSSVRVGRPIPEGQADAAVQYTIGRAVAMTICEAGGAAGQGDGNAALCAGQRAVVPKSRLLAMLGKVLYEQAELFAESRLDDREKHALMLDLSEKLFRSALVDHQRQNASLEEWRVELANRRSKR
jgi:hypothetical protein